MNVESQIKTHVVDPKDHPLLGFWEHSSTHDIRTISTKEQPCVFYHMSKTKCLVKHSIVACAIKRLASLTAFVSNGQPLFSKLMHIIRNCKLPLKYATDQVIVKYDAAIFHCPQQRNKTPLRSADNFNGTSCQVPDIYNDRTLNNVFIEDIDATIRCST